MESPPKEITKELLNKFIWGKNHNNPNTDHYHSTKLNIWKSLLLYAFNHHPFNCYESFHNNIITIPVYNKSIFKRKYTVEKVEDTPSKWGMDIPQTAIKAGIKKGKKKKKSKRKTSRNNSTYC